MKPNYDTNGGRNSMSKTKGGNTNFSKILVVFKRCKDGMEGMVRISIKKKPKNPIWKMLIFIIIILSSSFLQTPEWVWKLGLEIASIF